MNKNLEQSPECVCWMNECLLKIAEKGPKNGGLWGKCEMGQRPLRTRGHGFPCCQSPSWREKPLGCLQMRKLKKLLNPCTKVLGCGWCKWSEITRSVTRESQREGTCPSPGPSPLTLGPAILYSGLRPFCVSPLCQALWPMLGEQAACGWGCWSQLYGLVKTDCHIFRNLASRL